MAIEGLFLVDKSVLARSHLPTVNSALDQLAGLGLMATCSLIDLEIGYSARTGQDHSDLIAQRRQLPLAPIGQHTLERSLDIQAALALSGHHRVPLHDLIIAACAEEHRLTVLHYDKDFDSIARITGQLTQWVAPPGSLD